MRRYCRSGKFSTTAVSWSFEGSRVLSLRKSISQNSQLSIQAFRLIEWWSRLVKISPRQSVVRLCFRDLPNVVHREPRRKGYHRMIDKLSGGRQLVRRGCWGRGPYDGVHTGEGWCRRNSFQLSMSDWLNNLDQKNDIKRPIAQLFLMTNINSASLLSSGRPSSHLHFYCGWNRNGSILDHRRGVKEADSSISKDNAEIGDVFGPIWVFEAICLM